MKKRLAVTIILFTIVAMFALFHGQPVRYIAENDGEIEWHAYTGEKSA